MENISPIANIFPIKRTSSITDKWKWNSRNRQKTDCHTNIFKYVEGNHTDDPNTNACVEIIFRFHSYFCNLVYQKKEETNQKTCPNKPKLFSNHTKNKVGMTFRQINLARPEPFSCRFTRANCQKRTNKLITGRTLVIIGINPRIDSSELIFLYT